jgi:hypothetical protein
MARPAGDAASSLANHVIMPIASNRTPNQRAMYRFPRRSDAVDGQQRRRGNEKQDPILRRDRRICAEDHPGLDPVKDTF